jgi:histidyl-tRNA synthetase
LAKGGLPVKLYYAGPQFRYERPQRGRYRQFSQIGAELIGDPGPSSDAELLLMLVRFLEALGFAAPTVLLNTVGDEASRRAYREALVAFLEPHREALGEDSQRRLATNPLRILDTKVPHERQLLVDAPELAPHLTPASRAHFDAVRRALEAGGVDFRVEPRLVRGLDYYSRTVFELVIAGLGAQDALVGGGRYDGLIAELGGGDVPAIGFAIGQDRLLEALPASFRDAHLPPPPVHLVAAGGMEPADLLRLAESLRAGGLVVVTELGDRSLRSVLKRAARAGVRWLVVVGEDEHAAGSVSLRDLAAGEQRTMSMAEAVGRIKEGA